MARNRPRRRWSAGSASGSSYSRLGRLLPASPRCVIIAGEAGIGKSRLAEELQMWANRQGFMVAHSQAILQAVLPRLLLLDDLQWCDQETLEWLGHGQSEWRGQVRHVLSGEVRYFREWAALVAYLEGKVGVWGEKGGE